MTWLVDPAVVDAVRRLADGNPPRSLAPTITDEERRRRRRARSRPSPSAAPTDDTDEARRRSPRSSSSPEAAAAAEAGASWLERLHDGLEGSEILTLPYGDLDVAAAADHDPAAYRQARKRSAGDLLARGGCPTTPAVASPTGYLTPAGDRADRAGRHACWSPTGCSAARRARGRARSPDAPWCVTSSGAVERRARARTPRRHAARRAAADRQRGRRPAADARPASRWSSCSPSTWRPDPVTGFFDGLDLDWLNLTIGRRIADAARGHAWWPRTTSRYPRDAGRARARREPTSRPRPTWPGAGDTLQNLLTRNDQVGGDVRDEALTRPRRTPAGCDPRRAARRRPVARLDRGPAGLGRTIDAPEGASSSPAAAAGSPPPSPTSSTSR